MTDAFEEQIVALAAQLREDFAESERLAVEVKLALRAVGYDI